MHLMVSIFASIPFDRVVLEGLKERTQCFSRAKEAYPDLYETYEFQSLPEWYETGKGQGYRRPVRSGKARTALIRR